MCTNPRQWFNGKSNSLFRGNNHFTCLIIYKAYLMNKDEIKQLAERIASGIASDEEVLRYNQIYDSFQLSGSEWEDEIYGNKAELEIVMKKNIWEKTGIEKPVARLKWLRWAAAAAVMITLCSTSFFIFRNRVPDVSITSLQTQQERFKHDVAPGQQGAILTLSNGNTIVLDSPDNGSLAQEGGVRVTKKNGEIIYNIQDNLSKVVYNTMTTPKGRQYNLTLTDGSKVWLNAASSITFPTAFAGGVRKVSVAGEVYFEIAHRDQMPFIVQKEEMSIEVLGTHFNVNSYDDENSINVTLLEGSVKVTTGKANNIIRPGQQLQVRHESMKLIDNADIGAVMAWKNGLFRFQGAEIGYLMRQLSRWYDLEVVYHNNVDDLFYAEIPQNSKLSDVLKALELTGKVKFEISGNKLTVLP